MRLFLPALLAPLTALAQQTTPPADSNLAGGGVRSRPAYDGSASQRIDLVPLLDYDGRVLFARSTQGVLEGGAHAKLGSGFAAGAQLAYEEGRKAKESSFLRDRGIPDISVGASLGVHAQWEGKLGPALFSPMAARDAT
jgi:outer membrane scaffolding protein for murein synthesis (MipA/OmpV family)